MLRPLEEECTAAGMASRPGTGLPAVPRSPIEQISTFSGHSISSELGQTDWRISPYETNPPSSEEETGGVLSHCVSCTVAHAPLHHVQTFHLLRSFSGGHGDPGGVMGGAVHAC